MLVMALEVKKRGRKGSYDPFSLAKELSKTNQLFADEMVDIVMYTMKSLTPVDTGLTRDSTVKIYGRSVIPVKKGKRSGQIKGSVMAGSSPITITSMARKGSFSEFRSGKMLNRNYPAVVGPMTEYAQYVNEGTRRIAARRWIERTKPIAEREIIRRAKEVYKEKPLAVATLDNWSPVSHARNPFFSSRKSRKQ